MGAKKKGKTNKLARMSEEEKLRYLQHRAAIEEEAKRRKEQLISTFMKNKLKHEDAFTRLNSAKINQQWRQTLRQIKNNELQEGAETLRQTFNVAVETKDRIISTLLADLNDSVAMHDIAVQTHLESINIILGIQEERLQTLHLAYEEERRCKLQEAEISRSRALCNHKKDNKTLNLDIFWQKFHNDNSYEKLKKLSDDFCNNRKYKAMSEMRVEEEKSAKRIEVLKNGMQTILKNYDRTLSPYIAHYKQLRISDIKDMILLIEDSKTIHEKEACLHKLERILISKENLLNSTSDDFIKVISKEKKTFYDRRTELKNNQTRHERAMNNLSSICSELIKHLERLFQKINGIVYLNNSCEKFQNEKELLNSYIIKKDTDDVTDVFWRVYSEVITEVSTLSAHHANFIDENINLRHSLVKYMNTVSKPSTLTSCFLRDSY